MTNPDNLPKGLCWFLWRCFMCHDMHLTSYHRESGKPPYPGHKFRCDCGTTYYFGEYEPVLYEKHTSGTFPLIELDPDALFSERERECLESDKESNRGGLW